MYEVYVLVEKKKSPVISVFAIFSFVMGIISVLLTLWAFYFLPVALLCFGVGYFLSSRYIEFEYSYFDGDVRFAKITNKAKRKKLPAYKIDDVMMIAPSGDPSVYKYENESNAKIRRYQSGSKDAKLYVMAVKGEGGTELIYFEPDEKYLDAVCQKNGHKVRR